jgi:hypothetical protein
MVVYIYYITAARNSIIKQLTAPARATSNIQKRQCRGYGPSNAYKITLAGSLSSSQLGGPPCWTNPVAIGLIGHGHYLLASTLPSQLHYNLL